MRRIYSYLIIIILLMAKAGWAMEQPGDTIRPPRPKVGIVLSGGGAKGAAHIGVLKYIEEIGIPVDYVVGTSMGSIIGGLYALGYTPDELQKLISGIDWSKYMKNSVNRQDISSADKIRRSTYLATIPFNTGELLKKIIKKRKEDLWNGERSPHSSFIASLPSSFVSGADLLNLFNSLCIGYQDPIDFNELPIPFACVATNLTTGEATVLRSGKFPEAIRASMAIPGVFSPVNIDGQLLVDGGIVNNFPADVCREMGADIIIGIEVAEGMITDINELQSFPQLAKQMLNIVIKGNNDENRQLCDLYFHPQVSDYGTLSFNTEAIDTIVRRGYEHATLFRKQLLTLKKHMAKYNATKTILQAPKAQYISGDTLQLEVITMDNVSPKEFKWLLRKSKLKLGQPIPVSDVERAINIFKGTGNFSSIQYQMTPAKTLSPHTILDDFDMHIKFQRSEPHCLSIGLNYSSEESAALILNLGIGQNNFSGWRYNFTGRLGINTKINNTVTWAGLSLANFNLSHDFQRVKYTSLHTTGSEALALNRNRFRLFISEFHLRDYQANVGVESESASFTITPTIDGSDTSIPSRRLQNKTWGPYGKFGFDNMDHAYFAKKGLDAHLEIHERFNKQIASPLTDIMLTLRYHVSAGRFTFIPQLYSRHLFGKEVKYSYRNIVGGDVMGRYYDYQLPFIGINYTTLAKNQTSIVRLDLRYRLFQKHYLTLMGNYMRSADNLGTLFSIDNEGIGHWGCGVKYSYNSPFGPISFDIHYSNITNDWGSYFSLGYVF